MTKEQLIKIAKAGYNESNTEFIESIYQEYETNYCLIYKASLLIRIDLDIDFVNIYSEFTLFNHLAAINKMKELKLIN